MEWEKIGVLIGGILTGLVWVITVVRRLTNNVAKVQKQVQPSDGGEEPRLRSIVEDMRDKVIDIDKRLAVLESKVETLWPKRRS